MRINELDNVEAFINAIEEYVGWIGHEKATQQIANNTFFDELKSYECVLWEDGLTTDNDDRELCVIDYLCDLHVEGEEETKGAFDRAYRWAKEYAEKKGWEYESFRDLSDLLDDDGVVFDVHGNHGWMDGYPTYDEF